MTLVLVVVLLAGCASVTSPAPPTDPTSPTNASPTDPPTTGVEVDEPPLNFDGANDTLDGDNPPHVIRLTNDGETTKTLQFQVKRDGTTVFEQEFRSFPNTTVLGQLDHVGNYTLNVSVVGDGSATKSIAASSFDCNYSTTTFDVTDPEPTVRTVSTEMACEAADA